MCVCVCVCVCVYVCVCEREREREGGVKEDSKFLAGGDAGESKQVPWGQDAFRETKESQVGCLLCSRQRYLELSGKMYESHLCPGGG